MKRMSLWCLLLAVSTQVGSPRAADSSPTLPLPVPSASELERSEFQADAQLTNSVRAWFYNPDLVRPLLEVGAAVEDSTLTLEMRRMLAGVVASRNHCLY